MQTGLLGLHALLPLVFLPVFGAVDDVTWGPFGGPAWTLGPLTLGPFAPIPALARLTVIAPALAALAIGVAMQRWENVRRRADRLSTVLLVGVFPVCIALAYTWLEDGTERGAPRAIWSAVGLTLYLATVLAHPREHAAIRTSKAIPLPLSAQVAHQTYVRRLRHALVGLGAIAGLVFVAVIPFAGPAGGTWGDASREGRTLAVVIGTAVAAMVIAGVIGPSLRAKAPAPPRRGARLLSAVACVLCVIAYVSLRWFEAASPVAAG